MKLLALMLLASPLAGQNFLNVGMMFRDNPLTGGKQKSLEAVYVHNHASLIAEFQNSGAWYVGSRAYLNRHVFFQETLRNNRIPVSEAPSNHLLTPLHPWLLQTGIGVQQHFGAREMVTLVLSESIRLKTSSSGYVGSLNSEYDLGHHVIFRVSLLHAQALAEHWQVGVGFDYRFGHTGKP